MKREECNHAAIFFGSGDYYIFCKSCDATWVAADTLDKNSPELANKGVGASLSGEVRSSIEARQVLTTGAY